MSSVLCIIIIVVLFGLLLYYMRKEPYCSCTGTKTVTNRPTYFVYRPTGDVSDYAQPCSSNRYGLTSDVPDGYMSTINNTNWKKTLGPDCTASWAAGSGCDSSSVPLVSMSPPPPENRLNTYSVVELTSDSAAVPYAQNYGTQTCNLKTAASPCCVASRIDTVGTGVL